MFHSPIRRKHFILLLPIAALLLLFLGIFIPTLFERPVTSWSEYAYSFRERQQLKNSAKHNDYEAAYKLGMHYRTRTNDYEKAIYWLKIAAEGKHVEANKTLIKYMLFFEPIEERELIEECAQRLRELALSEMKPEDFYIKDLDL